MSQDAALLLRGALSMRHPDLDRGCGHMVDAWLLLPDCHHTQRRTRHRDSWTKFCSISRSDATAHARSPHSPDCHPKPYDLGALPHCRIAIARIEATLVSSGRLVVQRSTAEHDPEISSDVGQSLYFPIFCSAYAALTGMTSWVPSCIHFLFSARPALVQDPVVMIYVVLQKWP